MKRENTKILTFNFSLGEIFWSDVEYEDIPGESKIRPVIIVGELENILLILVATSSQSPDDPPKHHDLYKIPIPNWRKSGLTKPSWGLGLRLLEVNKEDFRKNIKDKDFIGKMYELDFQYLVHQIELIHEN
ncbi:MAG: type II toxin-antitoxin system PemK/MazF family toxin [Desulfosporosinus sp.]|nr:type II toxin-antitoxin system PemK/MazF family toxin [Desulfosporosinus sp.]